MRQFCCSVLFASLVLALAGCGLESGVLEPPAPWGPVLLEADLSASAVAYTDGDPVFLGGSLNEFWSPQHPDTLQRVGVVQSGHITTTVSPSVPAVGEEHTACLFILHGGRLYRELNISANGVPLTAIVESKFQVYRVFKAVRGDTPAEVIILTLRNDSPRLRQVTLRFTGIAFTDPANLAKNRPARSDQPVLFASTWNMISGVWIDGVRTSPMHPGVWNAAANAWELTGIWVVDGSLSIYRCESQSGELLLPGVFVNEVELKNIDDLDARMPDQLTGEGNYYPVMPLEVTIAGVLKNPRPGDERWAPITI